MNTTTSKKKVTLMLDEQVYDALRAKVGGRGIGAYLSKLARPHIVKDEIEAGYMAMANDKEYNKEADQWIEGVRGSIKEENNW